MIYLADVTKNEIRELSELRLLYIEQVKKLETYTITDKERLIKSTRTKDIISLNHKIKKLEKILDYQLNGNGIQKTWNGDK